MEKEAHKPETEKYSESHTHVNIPKKNVWMISTVVLVIISLILLFLVLSDKGIFGGVSKTEASGNLIKFLNENAPSEVTFKDISVENGLYKVNVDFQGQTIPVYMTKDGKYMASLQSIVLGSDSGNTNSEPVNIDVGNSPSIGNKDAKVTVIEFSDFSCPFCGAASGKSAENVAYMKSNDASWQPPVTGIMKDYVNTGKVRFVYKYSYGHSGGHPANLVGWCLNDQGLFWKFHDEAFAHQNDVEDLEKMKSLAKGVGADMTKLQSCLDSKKYDSQFDIETQQGTVAGVQGTPAFFVNGKIIEGAISYSKIKAMIDTELANSA